MRFWLYRLTDSPDVRVGAEAPWSDQVVVDVHCAEVAWLAARATSRRAHEIAEHLVPSQPGAFLSAGAHVWDFAREAVAAATPDAVTPRGEAVAVGRSACTLMDVLDELVANAEEVSPPGAQAARIDLASHPVLVIVGRHTHAVSRDDAWDHVAAYVDLVADPTLLLTAEDRPDPDSPAYRAVVAIVSATSAEAALLPGDIVCDPSVLAARRDADFEELLISA